MRLAPALVLAAGLAQPALAHDGATHATTTETAAHEAGPALPFPIEIAPRFALIDHNYLEVAILLVFETLQKSRQ